MASVASILKTQRNLEESLMQRMSAFEAHLKVSSTPSPINDLKSLSNDFSQFKDMVGEILTLLRQQISVLLRSVDILETRHRRKALLFNGVEEKDGEDLQASVISICQNKLGLGNILRQNMSVCHRLGASSRDRPRPVLVRFADVSTKNEVWSLKSKLKGTPVALSEFLTRHRQDLFIAARRHFGIRNVWTNEGNILVKSPDGKLNRIYDQRELDNLTEQHPQITQVGSSAATRTTTTGLMPTAASKSTYIRSKRAIKK